jgi:hypothetical protein
VEPYAKTAGLEIINQNNYTFITHQKLMELNPEPTDLFYCYFKNGSKGVSLF